MGANKWPNVLPKVNHSSAEAIIERIILLPTKIIINASAFSFCTSNSVWAPSRRGIAKIPSDRQTEMRTYKRILPCVQKFCAARKVSRVATPAVITWPRLSIYLNVNVCTNVQGVGFVWKLQSCQQEQHFDAVQGQSHAKFDRQTASTHRSMLAT